MIEYLGIPGETGGLAVVGLKVYTGGRGVGSGM